MASDYKQYLVVLFSVLLVAEVTSSCYKFTGVGRVILDSNLNIGQSASFKLKFRTKAKYGVLYYAEGLYHTERVFDYEGLFLNNGHLHYLLFNPAPYSIGSTFGFHGRSKEQLNDGEWHEVEFYRNIVTEDISESGERQTAYLTGLTVDGEVQTQETGLREAVDIRTPIILGEDPHLADRKNKRIAGFKGKIMDFQEVTRHDFFITLATNITGEVTHCISTGPDAM